jgi:hypothetical protein
VQATVGIEREIANNLTVNVSYISNRGVWLNSDGLTNTTNELTPSVLANKYGLNVTNPTDFDLLTQPISSPSVTARGFTAPYTLCGSGVTGPCFPSNASLAQALRPFPQFGNIGDYYEHDGNWWYDALQIKVTKRISRGLSGGIGYSWSKNLGTVGSTNQPTFTTAIPIQDPSLPPKSQKSFETIDQPQMINFYFNYELPAFSFDQNGWKRALFAGWTTDGIFHYQSGFPIQIPNSTSNLTSVTFATGVWANRVSGQPLFLHSLNDHKVNPRTTFFLNPAAWANPAPGTYAISKPYYGDYRGPRYPNEELGFGKVVPFREGLTFSLRADFFNVFNRWAYPNLNNTSNPFQTPQYSSDGSISNGFGFFGDGISGAGGNFAPRTADFVARIQF